MHLQVPCRTTLPESSGKYQKRQQEILAPTWWWRRSRKFSCSSYVGKHCETTPISLRTSSIGNFVNQNLDQLCPTRGPVSVFVVVKVSYMLTTCPYFDNLECDILMQVVLSATSSRLLPLQSGLKRFLYISLN